MAVSGALVMVMAKVVVKEELEVTRINVTVETKPEAATPAALGVVGADRGNLAEAR